MGKIASALAIGLCLAISLLGCDSGTAEAQSPRAGVVTILVPAGSTIQFDASELDPSLSGVFQLNVANFYRTPSPIPGGPHPLPNLGGQVIDVDGDGTYLLFMTNVVTNQVEVLRLR